MILITEWTGNTGSIVVNKMDLNYRPRSFVEGIRQEIMGLRKEGLIK
jgi:hypothetical protein